MHDDWLPVTTISALGLLHCYQAIVDPAEHTFVLILTCHLTSPMSIHIYRQGAVCCQSRRLRCPRLSAHCPSRSVGSRRPRALAPCCRPSQQVFSAVYLRTIFCIRWAAAEGPAADTGLALLQKHPAQAQTPVTASSCCSAASQSPPPPPPPRCSNGSMLCGCRCSAQPRAQEAAAGAAGWL